MSEVEDQDRVLLEIGSLKGRLEYSEQHRISLVAALDRAQDEIDALRERAVVGETKLGILEKDMKLITDLNL